MTLTVVMLGVPALRVPAQSNVYSLNVVGYYNVTLLPGWNLLANQLIQTNNNANFVLFPPPAADGSLLCRFNPSTQSFYEPGTYFDGAGWSGPLGDPNDPGLNLPLGEGFFVWTPVTWIATFAGEVPQGTLSNPLPAKYSLKASMVPQAGALGSDLGFPPIDNADVYFFLSPVQSYTDAFTYLAGYGWFDPHGGAGLGGPIENVGAGFFLRNPGPATTWLRNFTVNFVGSGGSSKVSSLTSPLTISQITVAAGLVRLIVSASQGSSYGVQFSSDRVSWATVAANQTGTLYQEPLRSGALGFYRLAANP